MEKKDLGINLPFYWAKPKKIMNYRCPKRVIKLLNKIRTAVDMQEQKPRTDAQEGFVRLFIFPSNIEKKRAESKAAERMVEITNDLLWSGTESDYKSLILEHHMAASRIGFLDMFESLYKIDTLKTGLLDGSLPGLRFFTQLILPIIRAQESGDQFAITRVVQNSSQLLSKKIMREDRINQLFHIQNARNAVNQLLSLWDDCNEPSSFEVLQVVAKTKLFDIPDSLYPLAYRNLEEINMVKNTEDDEQFDKGRTELELEAWDQCLSFPFSQIRAYDSYVSNQANFGTHQGVKGLEFPRVMVIIDDNESRGFLFSYEKLFGAKEKTSTDFKNEEESKDTTIDRTRRLFYVTCSRAEKNLAIIAYSEKPEMVKRHALEQGWFEESEIEIS